MKGYNFKLIARVLFFFLFFVGSSVLLYAQPKAGVTERSVVRDYVPPQPAVEASSVATFLGTLFKFAFSLVVIIVLVYLTVYILKVVTSRYKPSSILEGGMFDILDSLAIGANKSIYLIGINDKRILVLCISDREVSLLDKIENGDEVKEIISKTKEKVASVRTFKEHFRGAQRKKIAQENIRRYIGNLTDFFRSLKKN